MASVTIDNLNNAGASFNKLPVKRQLIILLMISASIAIGVIVAMWTRTPDLTPLYAQLDPTETQTIMDTLEGMGATYKYDRANGIMVEIDQVDNLRMKLASQGLPKTSATGYDLLDKASSFGTSQFMENVRYRRSLEGELAKTIMGLDAVRLARVHLGLPRQTSFLKRKNVSSASVMLDLYGGHSLTSEQVMGIVYLVSSSVSGLTKEQVSVIDQTGKLLTNSENIAHMSAAVEASNYVAKKEQEYTRKIQELLEPLLGPNSVRAEVSAFFDFTQAEETYEEFKNEKPVAIRSEALTEEAHSTGGAQGIPGALSNQPPSIATAPQDVNAAQAASQANPNNAAGTPGATSKTTTASEPSNYRNTATRNYEIDKKISHTKHTPGSLVRLSVAVVLNHKIISYDPNGIPIRQALTDAELAKVEGLVKQAIGYNADRGDSVSIVNSSFALEPPIPEPLSIFKDPAQILKKPWFSVLMKNLAGGGFILLLVFAVLRPMLKMLVEMKKAEETEDAPTAQKLELPPSDELTKQRIDHVKQLAHEDNKKAAQVVMNWVGDGDD